MLIQCGNCRKQFKASDALAGKRVKCPHCAQTIEVPVVARPVPSADPAAVPSRKPVSGSQPMTVGVGTSATPAIEAGSANSSLDDLLQEEFTSAPTHRAQIKETTRRNPFLNDAGLPEESPMRLPVRKSRSVYQMPGPLIWTTFASAALVLLVYGGIFHQTIRSLLAMPMLVFAACAWVFESFPDDDAGRRWLTIERWLGRILLGGALMLFTGLLVIMWVSFFMGQLHNPAGLWISTGVFIGMIFVFTIFLALSEQLGFFKAGCVMNIGYAIYCAVVLTAVAMNGRNPFEPAPVAVAKAPDGTDTAAGPVRVSPPVDNGQQSQTLPNNTAGLAPGTPVISPQVPQLAAWTAVPDPRREPIEKVSASGLTIPISRLAPIVFPREPSAYVAVGDNSATDSVRQLWDLRLGRAVGRVEGKIEFGENVAISPDGRRIAGGVQASGAIEVWSFEKNALEARIPAGSRAASGLLAFLDCDRLLYEAEFGGAVILQTWNLKLQATASDAMPVSPHFGGKPGTTALSPGGKYLVDVNGEQRVQVYDLATRQLAGEVLLPRSARNVALRVHGLCFSVDGAQLAGVFTELSKTRILAWNFADGSLTTDYEIAADLGASRVVDGAAANIESLPDRAGWLVFQRTLVPSRSGQQAWAKPVIGEAARLGSRLRLARIVDQSTLLAASDALLATFRLPRDANAAMSLGDGPIALESILTTQTPGSGSAVRANPAAPGPHATEPNANRDFEKQSLAYARDQYVELILGDGRALVERMQWLPAQKRPSIGLRWALGVQITGRTDAAAVHSLADLADVTGPIGPGLLDALQQRMADGKFGAWPKADDPRLREVRLLGSGKPAELQDSARRQGLDLLLQVDLDTQLIGFSKRWQTTAKVRIVDPSTGLTLWASEPLTDTQVALALRNGNDDPRVLLVQKVAAKIDLDYQLDKMPELTAEQVAHRLAEIGRQKLDRSLLVLAELRFYQAKKLAAHDDLDRLYDQILGPGGGRKMLEGTDAERREALQALLRQ